MSQPSVVITGAGSGTGLAAAEVFAGAGHPLLLISRSIQPLPEFTGQPVRYAQLDVADFLALRQVIQDAEQHLGGIDCLINSAGMVDARPFAQVEPPVLSATLKRISWECSTASRQSWPG